MAIVNINVSVTNPPKPSQLLKSGALVSVGGTTLAPGSYELLTSKRRPENDCRAGENDHGNRLGNEYRHGDAI